MTGFLNIKVPDASGAIVDVPLPVSRAVLQVPQERYVRTVVFDGRGYILDGEPLRAGETIECVCDEWGNMQYRVKHDGERSIVDIMDTINRYEQVLRVIQHIAETAIERPDGDTRIALRLIAGETKDIVECGHEYRSTAEE